MQQPGAAGSSEPATKTNSQPPAHHRVVLQSKSDTFAEFGRRHDHLGGLLQRQVQQWRVELFVLAATVQGLCGQSAGCRRVELLVRFEREDG